MPRASWNGAVIAESEAFELVEGNVYFPPEALDRRYLQPSATRTVCPWKGTAHYYDVVVEAEVNRDAAWCYASPKTEAAHIAGYVAFWKGVTVEDD